MSTRPWTTVSARWAIVSGMCAWMMGGASPVAAAGGRTEAVLEEGWRFHRGELAGAEQPGFDDSSWRTLSIPHDWAFDEGYSPHHAQRAEGGYRAGGIGWYRRRLELPKPGAGQRVRVEFDGAYMNSEVWINGRSLGRRPYGYISFAYEVTPYLRAGENVLAVRLDNSREPSARWSHPCGLYAPVRLVTTEAWSVARNGVHVRTPAVSQERAEVWVGTTLEGPEASGAGGAPEVETTVLAPDGRVLASERKVLAGAEAANGTRVAENRFELRSPELWDLDAPRLHVVVSRVWWRGQVVDETRTRFGLRSTKWEKETGFWLNGRNVKLRGVCEHLTGGPVGGAWTDSLFRWKIERLRAMGVNAIRTAHNPAPPRFYALCDEAGMLVMDEIFDGWGRKAPQDYGAQAFSEWWERDVREWVARGRNHPSIIIRSVGNETSGDVAPALVRVCHEIDPDRPVTSGHSGSEHMDVFGMNGHSERPAFFTGKRPDKPFVSTEAPHTWQVRGFYRTRTWLRDGPRDAKTVFPLPDLTGKEVFSYDWIEPSSRKNRKQVFNSSYDNATVRVSARRHWELVRDTPWISGHFRWTGFDYIGEAAYVHGGWPFRAFMGGVIDLAGFPKDHFYFYQSQWTEAPMVHLLPSWTHPRLAQGTEIPVWAYSNAEEVELRLNGRSLGRRRPGSSWNEMQCEWRVPWTPGVLEAIAYRGGVEVARTTQATAGAPARLHVERSPGEFRAGMRDAAIVSFSTVDASGRVYPYGENRVHVALEGAVRLRSLENGNPVDTEGHLGGSRRAFMGWTRAFLESTRDDGPALLTAGAILGELRQLGSRSVSIDVRTLALRGTAPDGEPTIYYTTDGREPDASSTRYDGPFSVPPGTTVKARVLRAGRTVLSMEERFAPDVGMYWPEEGAGAEDDTIEREDGNTWQAEDARFEGARLGKTEAGHRGTGYLEFPGGAGQVTWYVENDGSAGDARLRFRYAHVRADAPARAVLRVNGKDAGEVSFSSADSLSGIWRTVEIRSRLRVGANEVELLVTGGGGLRLDEMSIGF